MTRPMSLLLAASLVAGPSVAQTRQEPKLVLTIFGGVGAGRSLWTLGSQPFCGVSCSPPATRDTFQLSRVISSGLVAGVAASYFTNPHVGLQAEVAYQGMAFEDHCLDLSGAPNPEYEEACMRVSSSNLSTSAISFLTSVILRGIPGSPVSPYVRAGMGLVTQTNGTVGMIGGVQASGQFLPVTILADPSPKSGGVGFQIAAGITSRLGSGYQVRIELRDIVSALDRVTGPAGDNLIPSKSSRYYHHIGLTIGLDVVLEQKRGRRY